MTGVDVAIIGAGPAGSLLGLFLARKGYRTVLIEKASFPRPHVGESLPPSVLPLLRLAGLEEEVLAAGFLRPQSAIVRWGRGSELVRTPWGETGLQVDRGRFDAILLAAARAAGAELLPAGAQRPGRLPDGGWRIPLDRGRIVEARFLADASGRRRILGGALAGHEAATVALYAYWRSVALDGPETRVEAGPAEWYWGAPLPDGSFNATVFTDAARVREAKARGTSPAELYDGLLARSALLAPCREGGLLTGVRACDATCWRSAEPVSERHVQVGEAAFTIDPLSSQGVVAALQSAWQAGAAAHTILSAPSDAQWAIAFYRERLRRRYESHSAMAGEYYARMTWTGNPFWQRRARQPVIEPQPDAGPAPAGPFRWSTETRLGRTGALVGDRIQPVPALEHPRLTEPLAFLGGIPADEIDRAVRTGTQPGIDSQRWRQLQQWLWSRGLLEAAADHSGP